MSRIKLAFNVVDDLRELADSLEALVKTIDSNEEVSAPLTKKEEPITIEKVRAVLAQKSQAGKQPEVKALITKYSANKLTEIDASSYGQLLKEAGEL